MTNVEKCTMAVSIQLGYLKVTYYSACIYFFSFFKHKFNKSIHGFCYLGGVVGHIKVANFWPFDKSWKPGRMSDNPVNVAVRVFLNLLHSIIKCCSVSINLIAAVWFVVVPWQYVQMRWSYGITGRDLRRTSVASVCALMRIRVSDDLWFLFLTSLM